MSNPVIKCPNCGWTTLPKQLPENGQAFIIHCDQQQGGCGKNYVARVVTTITVTHDVSVAPIFWRQQP